MIGIDVQSMRGKMLLAAARVISEHGFEKSTQADVAEELGIKAPTLYYYFPTKMEMFLELVDLLPPNLRAYRPTEDMIEILIKYAPLQELIAKLLYVFPEEDSEIMYRLLRITIMESFSIEEVSKRYHQHLVIEHREYLESILLRMRAADKIPPMDTRAMAAAISDAVNFRAVRACMFGNVRSYLDYRANFGDEDILTFRNTVYDWLTQGKYSELGLPQVERQLTEEEKEAV